MRTVILLIALSFGMTGAVTMAQVSARPALTPIESLRGATALGLDVTIETSVPNLVVGVRERIGQEFALSGLTIVPGAQYPGLRVAVSTTGARASTTRGDFGFSYTLYAISVRFQRLLALPGQPTRTIAATTWQDQAVGFADRDEFGAMVSADILKLVRRFLAAHDAANGSTGGPGSTAGTPVPVVDQYGRLRYDAVDEGFVPPIVLSPNPKVTLEINLKKRFEGSLVGVEVTHAGSAQIYAGRRVEDLPRNVQYVATDDLAKAPLRSALVCKYRTANDNENFVQSRVFWYRTRPVGLEPERLAQRLADHPLLWIGPPLDNCPARFDDARAAAGR